MTTISRRGIIGGLASMLAAPAIVHYGNLMPVKAGDWTRFGPSLELDPEFMRLLREAFNDATRATFRVRAAAGEEITYYLRSGPL
jgi:DNA-binding sugar fermentation-stimulating protein